MALHFSEAEFEQRLARLNHELANRRLDGILLFKQESMYYLTGYDSLAYIFFQCLYVGADGTISLLTRPQDVPQAHHTSTIRDIQVWADREGVSPAEALRELLGARGCRGARLGIESDAFGLSFARGKAVEAALAGFCVLEETSDLVSRLRARKSPSELAYVRRAAELADRALEEVNALAAPGRFDGDLLAAVHGTIFRGGGGYPANECIMGSGEDAILVRHHAGRRHLARPDQLTTEFAASYRRYHAGILRTILIGEPDDRHRAMHGACRDALAATEEAVRPGATFGEIFDAHAATFDAAGFREERLQSCGYGLGATFPPSWVDWPMIYAGNRAAVEPGMVLLLLMILLDEQTGRAMGLGRTVRVTERGCEPLSAAPLDLVAKE